MRMDNAYIFIMFAQIPGYCLEAKCAMNSSVSKTIHHVHFDMHLQYQIYTTGRQAKMQTFEFCRSGSLLLFWLESESILYLLQPSFSSSKSASIKFSLKFSLKFLKQRVKGARRIWNKGDPMICHLSCVSFRTTFEWSKWSNIPWSSFRQLKWVWKNAAQLDNFLSFKSEVAAFWGISMICLLSKTFQEIHAGLLQ